MVERRICFFGDSVTVGTGDAACRGWPSYLCEAETARGHDVTCYSLGIRGQTCPQIAARWRAEAGPRLPPEFPGRLVFMFGLNDCWDDEGTGVRVPPDRSVVAAKALLTEASAFRPVLWVGPPPVSRVPQSVTLATGETYRDRAAALSRAYAEAAREIGVPYVDLHAVLFEDDGWEAVMEAGDRIHPTEAGSRRIAEIVGADPAWRAWFNG